MADGERTTALWGRTIAFGCARSLLPLVAVHPKTCGMGVAASLVQTEVRVAPGGEVVCPIQVRNTGSVVDQFTVTVLGPAGNWAVAEPPVLNLFPGDTGQVLVRFQPPRSSQVLAGTVPFGVRLASQEDPEHSWVEEGTVEVEPFVDLHTELLPITSRGRRKGKHRLEVENLGNTPMDTQVLLADPADKLRFKQNVPGFVAMPGFTNKLKIVAIPRKRFMRGPDVTHPFQILLRPAHEEPGQHQAPLSVGPEEQVNRRAEYVQRAQLPGWLVPLIAGIVALAVVLAVLWFALLKPSIKSAAHDAASQQASAVAANLDEAKKAAQQANDAASAAAGGGAGAGTGAGGAGAGSTPTAGPAVDPTALNQPVALRIQADAAPRGDGGFNTFTFNGQSNKPLDLTDLALQNPAGDSGLIHVRRNGQPLLTIALDNFRDYSDHYVVPIRFNKGETLTFAVSCKTPGAGNKHCTPGVTVSGRTTV